MRPWYLPGERAWGASETAGASQGGLPGLSKKRCLILLTEHFEPPSSWWCVPVTPAGISAVSVAVQGGAAGDGPSPVAGSHVEGAAQKLLVVRACAARAGAGCQRRQCSRRRGAAGHGQAGRQPCTGRGLAGAPLLLPSEKRCGRPDQRCRAPASGEAAVPWGRGSRRLRWPGSAAGGSSSCGGSLRAGMPGSDCGHDARGMGSRTAAVVPGNHSRSLRDHEGSRHEFLLLQINKLHVDMQADAREAACPRRHDRHRYVNDGVASD